MMRPYQCRPNPANWTMIGSTVMWMEATNGRLSGPAIVVPYCLSTSGPPQQVSDSEHAQAPSSLSAQDLSTWSSSPHSSQTYTSPTFISLHDAIALTTFR